jgi:hypothetical protein
MSLMCLFIFLPDHTKAMNRIVKMVAIDPITAPNINVM